MRINVVTKGEMWNYAITADGRVSVNDAGTSDITILVDEELSEKAEGVLFNIIQTRASESDLNMIYGLSREEFARFDTFLARHKYISQSLKGDNAWEK